jgi:hypothetical protein
LRDFPRENREFDRIIVEETSQEPPRNKEFERITKMIREDRILIEKEFSQMMSDPKPKSTT